MSGAAALFVWVLSWAPNDYHLQQAIESADRLELRLVPWSALVEPLRPIWLVPQDHAPTTPAVFLPAARSGLAAALASGGRWSALRVPRLILSREHFLAAEGDSWRPLEELAPDSVERLVHAMLEARWHRLLEQPAVSREVEARAERTMAEVPEAHRRDAFLTAVNGFVSHLLSIGHEIGRHQRRRAARGDDLCAAIDHPVTLFGSWRRAVEEGGYRGYKPIPRAPKPASTPSPERPISARRGEPRGVNWVWTSAVLSAEDKRWMLDHLGLPWIGDPRRDFGFLCPQDS